MRVETKAEAYRLYHSGEFGNRLQSFDTMEELLGRLGNDYRGTLAIRYKVPGSPFFQFDIPGAGALREEVSRLVRQGADPALMVFSEQADDSLITVQGEVRRSPAYLDLTFSEVQRPMRLAFLTDRRRATGAEANLILRAAMDPPSWENLWRLLDRYDGAVVEFSCYARSIGDLGHNTLFWEVRHF